MDFFRGRWWQPRGDRWLYAILLIALVLRLYHIAYPPWDYHNWRQTQTLMVARDFVRRGFDLLHPQVQWVSNGPAKDPSYYSGEFSIESVCAALLYKVFGESDVLARIVVIAFSLLGIYFLYQLLNRRAGRLAARIGAFLYALLPYHLFFGRVFMPDVPALSLALGGLFFLDRWTGDRKPATLLTAAVFTAAAILQKLTVVFVGLPALYLFWLAQGRKLFARAELYVFAAVAGAPSVAWYIHANAMARQSGFALMQPGVFGRHLASWVHADFLHRALAPLSSEAFAPAGLALSVLGFFWPARNPAFGIFRLWIAGAGLLLFLVPDLLSANYYYFSLLLPGGAALGGLVLARLASKWTAYPLVGVILAIFAIEVIGCAIPLYHEDRAPRDLGVLLNRLTTPSDLIATETGGSPNVLYFADRRGWMLGQQYDLGLLRKLAKAGALYYADPSTADIAQQAEFFRQMDANFERLTPDQGPWPIYCLSAMPESVLKLPVGNSGHPLHVGEAELLDVSLRKLAESPVSLELLFSWRCLKEPAAGPIILVRIENAAGETVYQANYSLPARRLSSRRQAGEILRQRRVMVLPGSLPKGKYRVCLGSFDTAVGEVDIKQTPHYGWFRAN